VAYDTVLNFSGRLFERDLADRRLAHDQAAAQADGHQSQHQLQSNQDACIHTLVLGPIVQILLRA
jgi:hypothetical protein